MLRDLAWLILSLLISLHLAQPMKEAMVKYTTGMVLVITTGVLGGLVCVMGLIYTYIYCTRMKPRTRWKWGEGRISHYPPPRVETGRLSGAEAGGAAGGIKTHPFFIMHYMNKARREAAATAAGSSAT